MLLTLPCPAKINLFLEVRGRRADRFHELGTLFAALETGETLSAEPWDRLELVGADGVTADPGDNLILRAANLLQERMASRLGGSDAARGIRFSIEKKLPMGAGLGGGSSDAATALRLANQIWNLGATDAELQAIGGEIGSDVAFFLSAPAAYGEGRGEILTPAPAPYPFYVVIATPQCHVETGWAYKTLAASLDGKYGARWPDFKARFDRDAQNPELYRDLFNDFEAPIAAHFPKIRAVRERLEAFAPEKAMLTGSGASLFALFRDETRAKEALAETAPFCRFSVMTRFARG